MRRPTGTPGIAAIAVVSACGRTIVHFRSSYCVAAGRMPVSDLDIVEHRFAIEPLSNGHASLAPRADRAIAQEVPEEARECHRLRTPLRRVHLERHATGIQVIARLVEAGLIERCLEAHDDAIALEVESIGAHPRSVSAKNLMVGRADQCAAVLQRE